MFISPWFLLSFTRLTRVTVRVLARSEHEGDGKKHENIGKKSIKTGKSSCQMRGWLKRGYFFTNAS